MRSLPQAIDQATKLTRTNQTASFCYGASIIRKHLDLALRLIRKVGPERATLVSRYLLADIRSSQAVYIIPNHLAQADPLIFRFERWAREHLQDGFSLQVAAKTLATSALQRLCQTVRSEVEPAAPLVLSGCAAAPDRQGHGRSQFSSNVTSLSFTVRLRAGRIMALVETALPMLMSGEPETLGFHDYGGKLDTAFMAHPKICPIKGELHFFFGYAQQPPFLTYHVVNASGELTRSIPFQSRGPTMVRDFMSC